MIRELQLEAQDMKRKMLKMEAEMCAREEDEVRTQ